MAARIKLPVVPRPVAQHVSLRPEELSLLARRARVEGTTAERVTLAQVDRWLATTPQDDPERTVLLGVREAAVGDGRTAQAQVVGPREVSPLDFRNLAKPADVVGEPQAVQKLRRELPAALWGQEQALPGFLELADDFASPLRAKPPVLAISGPVGHGKDGAVDGLRRSLLGEPSELARVDLSQVRDGDFAALFGDEGPLALQRLKDAAAASQAGADEAIDEGEPRPLLVHLTGADDLQTRAPKVAEELSRRFLAVKGEPDHAFVSYVVDFDGVGDPQALMASALGREGSQVLSGTSEFGFLDAGTLQRYAEDVALPRALKAPGLGRVFLEFDDDAREVLGRALATPDAPLVQLKNRLQRFLLKHFDTQTSIDRGDSVLRVRLHPRFAEDADALDAKLASLMDRPGALAPDLSAGNELFWVTRVAQSDGLSVAQLDTLEAEARTALGAAAAALDASPLEVRSSASLADLAQRLTRIEQQHDELTNQARSNVTMKLADLAPEGRVRALREELEGLSAAVQALRPELVNGLEEARAAVKAARNAVERSLDTLSAPSARRPRTRHAAEARALTEAQQVATEAQPPAPRSYISSDELVERLMALDRAHPPPPPLDELLDEAERQFGDALGRPLTPEQWVHSSKSSVGHGYSSSRALHEVAQTHRRILGRLGEQETPKEELYQLLRSRARARLRPDSPDATSWATIADRYHYLRKVLSREDRSPEAFKARWQHEFSAAEREELIAEVQQAIRADREGPRPVDEALHDLLATSDVGPGYRLVLDEEVYEHVRQLYPLRNYKNDTSIDRDLLRELTGREGAAFARPKPPSQNQAPRPIWVSIPADAPLFKGPGVES